jgi:hypothetical protein
VEAAVRDGSRVRTLGTVQARAGQHVKSKYSVLEPSHARGILFLVAGARSHLPHPHEKVQCKHHCKKLQERSPRAEDTTSCHL